MKRIVSTSNLQPLKGRTPIFEVPSHTLDVHYSDGTSQTITFDTCTRRSGTRDAVAIIPVRKGQDGWEILLHMALRPNTYQMRGEDETMFIEVPAGTFEKEDEETPQGARTRAAAELHEETGYKRRAEDGAVLGHPAYASSGKTCERIWYVMFEIDPTEVPEEPEGDGSSMEVGCWNEWVTLATARARVRAGEISDQKVETALGRLRDWAGL